MSEEFNPNLAKKEEEALKKAREEHDNKMQIPSGFIECRLSTKGLVGAPEVFHIKNFSTEDLMNLGLSDQEDAPVRLTQMLQSIIFEPDVRIEYFHEKEVIELLLFIYERFYTTIFPNQPWVPTDEDWDFIAEQNGGKDTDEFRRIERSLKDGSWKPVFDIDLATGLQFNEIDKKTFKKTIKVTREYDDGPFSVKFGLPKYGDVIVLKHFIESVFRDEDRRYAAISETIKFKRDAEKRWREGENINLRQVPNVPKVEYDKLKDYEHKKTMFAITATKAIHLVEFNGENIEQWPLEKKIELAKDPRIDHATFAQVEETLKQIQFGLKEEITVRDPIIGQVVTRKYSFQLDPILTAYHSTRPAKTTISLE